MGMTEIKFKSDEFWILSDILNEVCHGIKVNNFEKTIGVNKQTAIDLMDRIWQEKDKDEINFTFNDSELSILRNSFAEVFRQIDEWEFQTRIGITIPEANKIKEKLK